MEQGIQSLREYAKRYMELATSPEQERKRALWRAHNSLQFSGPLIYVRMIPYHEFFDFSQLRCEDPFLRSYEYKMASAVLFQQHVGDDYIFEPWMTLKATMTAPYPWGVPVGLDVHPTGKEAGIGYAQTGTALLVGGSAQKAHAYAPFIHSVEDFAQIIPQPYGIDEEKTRANHEKLTEALQGIIPVHIDRRAPLVTSSMVPELCYMIGLEQMMWNVYDNPELLHTGMTLMRDAVLGAIDATQGVGAFSSADHTNQSVPYARELPDPDPAKTGLETGRMWMHMHAQETTTLSPEALEIFFLQYQKPVMERFGLSAYGCCEDLTRKIHLLRGIKNLRRIAVTPWADKRRCAEQIGGDYVISYRPNPAQIAAGLDEDYVRAEIHKDFMAFKENNCIVDVTMKDNETIGSRPDHLIRWVQIVRETGERVWG